MQKIIKSIIIIIFVFILGIFFLSLNRTTNYNTEYLVGNNIEIIELQSLVGEKIFVNEDLKKNSFTLINFWASWCALVELNTLY